MQLIKEERKQCFQLRTLKNVTRKTTRANEQSSENLR